MVKHDNKTQKKNRKQEIKNGDTFTCHTEGCENQGIEIVIDFIPEDQTTDFIVCGACGNGS